MATFINRVKRRKPAVDGVWRMTVFRTTDWVSRLQVHGTKEAIAVAVRNRAGHLAIPATHARGSITAAEKLPDTQSFRTKGLRVSVALSFSWQTRAESAMPPPRTFPLSGQLPGYPS